MSYLSINPNSEPPLLVKTAAYAAGAGMGEITPTTLAEIYNAAEEYHNNSDVTGSTSMDIDAFITAIDDALST